MTSKVGVLSLARCLGRVKGTSIGVFSADFAMVPQSVLRIILSKKRHSRAASNVYSINSFPLSGFVFFLVMMLYNVYGHLGWELYPAGFSKHFVGKWINTSVNHNQHHQFFKGNYGLYFLFWDRMMGTLRADYDIQFEKVTTRQPSVAKAQTAQVAEV